MRHKLRPGIEDNFTACNSHDAFLENFIAMLRTGEAVVIMLVCKLGGILYGKYALNM